MKDQVLALEWIKKNIKYFGGNHDSITLTGGSAGATSMHFHYFSQQIKNLFNRGMSVSGTALNSWALQENASARAKTLGAALGCSSNTSQILIECLRTKSAYDIVNATITSLFPYIPFPLVPFAPVVQKSGHKPFLKEHPYRRLQKKQLIDVPWLTSHVSHEEYLLTLCKCRYFFIQESFFY